MKKNLTNVCGRLCGKNRIELSKYKSAILLRPGQKLTGTINNDSDLAEKFIKYSWLLNQSQ